MPPYSAGTLEAGYPQVVKYAIDQWDPGMGLGAENAVVWADLNVSNGLQTRYIGTDKVDQLLARVDAYTGNTAYWYLLDRQNSTRDVITNTASLADTINYDAFGNITWETSPMDGGVYKYTGREVDVETGLQYNRARYYDPTTARWITQDPLGYDAGDSNLYRYVNNSPTTRLDPSGQRAIITVTGRVVHYIPDKYEYSLPLGGWVPDFEKQQEVGAIVVGTDNWVQRDVPAVRFAKLSTIERAASTDESWDDWFMKPENGKTYKEFQEVLEKSFTPTSSNFFDWLGGGLVRLGQWIVEASRSLYDTFTTNVSAFVGEKVGSIGGMMKLLGEFGGAARQLWTEMLKDPAKLIENLKKGAIGGFGTFMNNFGTDVKDELFKWISKDINVDDLKIPETWDKDSTVGFVLHNMGLSWASLQQIVIDKAVKTARASDVAIATRAYSEFAKYADKGDSGLYGMLQSKAEWLENLDGAKVLKELEDPALGAVQDLIVKKALAFAGSVATGTSVVSQIYGTLDWAWTNYQKLQDLGKKVFSQVIGGMHNLVEGNTTELSNNIYGVLKKLMPVAISYIADRLKLGDLPKQIADAVFKVKNTVKTMVEKVFDSVWNYAGAKLGFKPNQVNVIGAIKRFENHGKHYSFWATNGRVIWDPDGIDHPFNVSPQGGQAAAKVQYQNVVNAADSAYREVRNGRLADATRIEQGPLAAALNALQAVCQSNQCQFSGGACFALGTKLLTPEGYKTIELFRVGDEILSRSEFDPHGPLEKKAVEEVVIRTGKLLHLHVNGQVIQTTSEHPFWVKGKGWLRAGDLQYGDELVGHDGQWVAVEEVYDTGEWETVYNLRISDYHTYFVSGEDWGFSVWSHNTGGACDGPPSGNLTADTLRVLQERLDGTPKRTVVLRGDASYTILGGSAHYYTNADGQLSRVTFNLTQQTGRNGPAGNTTWMGRLGTTGDQGGHILGKQYNGSNQYPNLVPMNAGISAYPVPQNDWNGGAYGYLESFWSSALAHHRNGSNVGVQLDYPTVESLRPSRFVLNFTIGGNPFEFPLRNSASQALPTEQDMQRLREAIGVE
jgi:RHS repeat-associated protein